MSNSIYTRGQEQVNKCELDWETNVIRVLLVSNTSTYTPDKRNDYLDSFISDGGVEITVPSYTRKTLTGCSVVINDAIDKLELHCNNILFGRLQSGQTVKAILVYAQVGGDDSTPEDDILIAYIDTDASGILPVSLAGSEFSIIIDADGFIQISQGS